jgi:hypothetical protein
MLNAVLSEDRVRLEIFELQPRSANIVAGEKIDVAFRQSIARAVENRPDRLQRMRIVLGRLRLLLRQRLSPPIGVRRRYARSFGSQRMLLF